MKHPPETVRRASVYIGRVIDRCDGAFAQNLGIDGRYAIHRIPNPPEVGDVVTVEVKADQLIVGVKYRPTLRARR
jgi:hypothetical protein